MARTFSNLRLTSDNLQIGANDGTITSIVTTATGGNKTITLPNATDTVICRATTDTLKYKTIIDATNRVAATDLRNNGTGAWSVSMDGTPVPTTGQVLTASSSSTAKWATPVLMYNSSGLIAAGKIFTGQQNVTTSSVTFDITAAAFSTIYSINMIALNTASTAPIDQVFCTVRSQSLTSIAGTLTHGAVMVVAGTSLVANDKAVTVYLTVFGK